MEKLKEKIKSVRFRLFIVLCIVIMFLVICLVVINSLVLGNFYMYSKTNTIKEVYTMINDYYTAPSLTVNLEEELKKISYKNNFDILIQTDTNLIAFSTDKDFLDSLDRVTDIMQAEKNNNTNIIYSDENMKIRRVTDTTNNLNYVLLTGKLVNDYNLYIRIPIAPIEESVRISNNVLILIGMLTIFAAAFVASFISRKFTEPIVQLNDITNQMAKLDFSKKYRITDSDDEINELGKNINTMSDKLESTIKQLRDNNIELEKDIEEKSKIDEMRKQFIQDVSHELKTPIALIQGYSEGLIENVNTDPENREFYAKVILDEANKMDKLVKQLLELMKLEYGKREFNNEKFDICELIQEVVRKSRVMLEENNIQVEFDNQNQVYVYADSFYIEQVMTNYFTNAVKHVKEVNGKKLIRITTNADIEKNIVRISVFNTGDNIKEEDLNRIWNRFYKVDASRNRDDGGTGIGLALVKAIMNNYKKDYGAINRDDGIEFYFDLDLVI